MGGGREREEMRKNGEMNDAGWCEWEKAVGHGESFFLAS